MEVRRTGIGTHIDCSMLGCMLGISALQISEYFGTGRSPQPLGSAHPRNAPYQAFQGSDKPFVIAAGNDKLWVQVCGAVGMPELSADERFVTQTLRAANQRELAGLLQQCFGKRSAMDWLREFDQRGVPCAPINDFADILVDPHVQERGWITELTLPNGMTTPTIGYPVHMSGYEFRIDAPPPRLGENTEEVCSEWLR